MMKPTSGRLPMAPLPLLLLLVGLVAPLAWGPASCFLHRQQRQHYDDLDVDVDLQCDNYDLELSTERQLDDFEPRSECPAEARVGLRRLRQLIGERQNDDCSPRKLEAIGAFHRLYISRRPFDDDHDHGDYDHAKERTRNRYSAEHQGRHGPPLVRLPIRWRRLFLAYCLKLSEVCRHQAVELLADSKRSSRLLSKLNENDWQLLNRWANATSPTAQVLGEPRGHHHQGHQGPLVVPKMLVKALQLQTKTYVEATAGVDLLRQVQLVCGRRFRPIYAATPLLFSIEMAKLGFNYGGPIVGESSIARASQMYKWYRIALICESLDNLVLVRGASSQNQAANTASGSRHKRGMLLKVIQSEEARLKLAQGELHLVGADRPELEHVDMIEQPAGETTTTTKGSRSRHLLDELQSLDAAILDRDDKQLARALDAYHEPSLAIPLKVLLKHFHRGMYAKLRGGAARLHKLVKSKLASCSSSSSSPCPVFDLAHEEHEDLDKALSNSIEDLARQLGGLKSPFWQNRDSTGVISSSQKELGMQAMLARLWFALFLEALIVLVVLASLA